MTDGLQCDSDPDKSVRLTALVIGDTGVIGSAIAEQLTEAGWYVVGVSRSPVVCSTSPAALRFCADARDGKSVEGLAHNLTAADLKIDMLVHAYGSECHVELNDPHVVSHCWDSIVNGLVAPLIASHRLVELMSWNSLLVFFSGGGALKPPTSGWNVSYAAAKAGLHRAAEALALQLASRHIWVTIIDPGWVPHSNEDVARPQEVKVDTIPSLTTLRSPQAAARAVLAVFAERGITISGKLISVLRDYQNDIVRLKTGDHKEDFLSLRLSDG